MFICALHVYKYSSSCFMADPRHITATYHPNGPLILYLQSPDLPYSTNLHKIILNSYTRLEAEASSCAACSAYPFPQSAPTEEKKTFLSISKLVTFMVESFRLCYVNSANTLIPRPILNTHSQNSTEISAD